VMIALAYLFDPGTYTVTTIAGTRHVAQEPVFWLPAFVTMLVGLVSLPIATARTGAVDPTERRQARLVASCFGLCILGSMKESNFIPSLGDPLLDMLLAFVPYTAASLCLLLSAMGLRRSGPRAWAVPLSLAHPDRLDQAIPEPDAEC
jgi:hypothetical protein